MGGKLKQAVWLFAGKESRERRKKTVHRLVKRICQEGELDKNQTVYAYVLD